VQQVAGPAALWKVTCIFDKHIPRSCQLAINKERGFAGEISHVILSGAVQREHSRRRPFRRQLPRPCNLNPGIVPVAGHGFGSSRKTEKHSHGNIESSSRWAELFFYSDREVAESRAEAAGRIQIVVIVRHREAQFCILGNTEAQ